MHHKDIKAKIKKQLKIEYPNWNRLSRKKKKAVAKMVLDKRLQLQSGGKNAYG